MKLTERQKALIRHELSGEENTLVYFIKRDVNERLWALALDEEDILSLSKMEEFFRDPDYVVADEDPEVDDIILYFEKEILWIWGSIRRHLTLYSYDDNYDFDFDKKGVIREIDEEVKKYLERMENN